MSKTQKDFQEFIANPCKKTAIKILKHKDKIAAQCVYGDELKQALKYV